MHDETALVRLLIGLAGRRNLTLVVAARDPNQRRRLLQLGLPGVLIPDGLADAVSVLAGVDFVVGMGGAMLREAAALGTPAYTLSPSADPVEASLLGDGRLRRIAGPDSIVLRKKDLRTSLSAPRDPGLFCERLRSLAERSSPRTRLGRFVRDITDESCPPTL